MDIPKHYDEKASEKRWQEYWEKLEIYKFVPDSDKEIYSIDTPPPTISGYIHMGHAFSYAQADFIARFQRMLGKNIFYPFGFDDNGLATERLVEKEKKIKAHMLPREKFIETCLEVSKKYEMEFKEFWGKLGLSCDWSLLYSTIDEWCRKTSQRSFIELYEIGREYRKESPTMWCPECQTAIAQVELQDKELPSNFNEIVFKVEKKFDNNVANKTENPAEDEDLIIATTRPELLPACVAIFANPEDNRYSKYFGKKAKVPLFDYYVPIIPDRRATPEKGTGIVMCCTFGDQTDMEWYHAHNLPLRIAITRDGKMNELAGKYAGMSIKEARSAIISDLKNNKLLVAQQPITHYVNVHERCGTEIEFLVTKQWFIEYLDLKEQFLEQGRKLNWHPKHMKVRYDNWISGLQWDWCISRQRYFGVPIPVWYCKENEHVIVAEEHQLPVDPLKDKPPVEVCPVCGCREFIPEKDVLDTWATSSLTPMINCRWKDNQELWKKLFPMSLRPQAHDIITFWLFNTVVKSWLHTRNIPWKDVMISGHGLDAKGKKMSKSKGNIVHPGEVIEKYSADCLRFWAAGSKLGDDLPYQEKDVLTGKKFATKLWNASRFVILNLGGYKHEEVEIKDLTIIDRWILSQLHSLIRSTTEAMHAYEYTRLKSETERFFWHTFCDNYLEIVKDRFFRSEKYTEKEIASAKYTLYIVNLAVLKLMAPIMPYITEEIYQLFFASRDGARSIHISHWPEFKHEFLDGSANKIGQIVSDVVSAARKTKTEKNLSLKAPVKKIVITAEVSSEELKMVERDIIGATNAQQIEYRRAQQDSDFKCNISVEI
ncbi:MAG: valine--tRNA ligase [Candidatus Woesearchaeota archaeon]